MMRIATLAVCGTLVCLVCAHFAAAINVEQLCQHRCLYGRGGILCNCNAMHFKGKRSHQAYSTLIPTDLFTSQQADHRPTENGEVASRRLQSSGALKGSQMAYGRGSYSPSARQIGHSWDASRAKQFWNTLERVSNGVFSDKPKGIPDSVGNLRKQPSFDGGESSALPLLTWDVILKAGEEQEGRHKNKPKRLQQQQRQLKAFSKPAASHSMDLLPERHSGGHLEDTSDDTKAETSQENAETDNLLLLQDVLARALHGE